MIVPTQEPGGTLRSSAGRPTGTGGCRPPVPPHLSQHRWIDDQVPERPDRGDVSGAEQSIWLHVDGHMGAEPASIVRDPANVHHPMHGPVGDLCCPLVLEQVHRGEGECGEVRTGWGVAQICRQPVAERRHPGAEAGVRAIPAEQLAELPADREERANGDGGALRRVARRNPLYQQREVVRAADPRQLPDVLEPKVAGELVDPPGPESVRAVREPHWWTSIHTVAYK